LAGVGTLGYCLGAMLLWWGKSSKEPRDQRNIRFMNKIGIVYFSVAILIYLRLGMPQDFLQVISLFCAASISLRLEIPGEEYLLPILIPPLIGGILFLTDGTSWVLFPILYLPLLRLSVPRFIFLGSLIFSGLISLWFLVGFSDGITLRSDRLHSFGETSFFPVFTYFSALYTFLILGIYWIRKEIPSLKFWFFCGGIFLFYAGFLWTNQAIFSVYLFVSFLPAIQAMISYDYREGFLAG
jgi:hypothetical protein